jgi:mannan endo-1,4-beta-mannosidase
MKHHRNNALVRGAVVAVALALGAGTASAVGLPDAASPTVSGAPSSVQSTPSDGVKMSAPASAPADKTTPTADVAAASSLFRIINKSSKKCLTPWGSGDGTAITQVTCDGSSTQLWSVNPAAPYGEIINASTGKCLDLWRNGSANGQLVFTWSCYNGYSQQWRLLNKGDQNWELHPYYTDKCLDLDNSVPDDGATIQQWGCTGIFDDNQIWWLG